jgi:hypothetical protein
LNTTLAPQLQARIFMKPGGRTSAMLFRSAVFHVLTVASRLRRLFGSADFLPFRRADFDLYRDSHTHRTITGVLWEDGRADVQVVGIAGKRKLESV